MGELPASDSDRPKSAHGNSASEYAPDSGYTIEYMVPPNSTRLWDVLVVFFYHMLPFTMLPLASTVLLLWWGYRTYGFIVPAGYVTFLALAVAAPLYYNPKIRRALQFLYVPMARYMKSVKFARPTTPFPDRPYIIGIHPHGRMFYTNSMMIQLYKDWLTPVVPKGQLFGAAAAGFFAVPILRHLLFTLGAMPASRGNIVKKLRKGDHVAIIIGGVKEVCLGTSDGVDTLYLRKRKGFARIAVEENVGIIPVYCFNENQLFRHDSHSKLAFWEKVNRYVNVGVPFMRGVWGLPMPFRRDLMVAIGEPIFPKEGESVDELQARYVEALNDLFHKYVRESPEPDTKLVIT